ncbi:hypothetical protein SKAU_G00274960 [Synaphobranchus kaupii]|uniref:Uncharacterized protein n=1 Tax=Synaphobranchus kaupii TaxID=118154 RepID=A0A9Q1F122_SYNKA|nr:hypothetical protein SKAU_G00274960 [Synaphobranchus kaupii]
MNEDADHAPPPSLSISADQVRSELRRLHPSKAAGPDGISPKVLKERAALISRRTPQGATPTPPAAWGRPLLTWQLKCFRPCHRSQGTENLETLTLGEGPIVPSAASTRHKANNKSAKQGDVSEDIDRLH